MKQVVVVKTAMATALGDEEATWQALRAGRSGLRRHAMESFAEPLVMGRVDGLAAAPGTDERLQALLARLLVGVPELPAQTALICATTKGAVDELLLAPGAPWPGQPPELAAAVAGRLKINHEYRTVSAACASGTVAIMEAVLRLGRGECEAALVVGVDLISRFVQAGFASLQALAADGCRPFDDNRDGLSLGEGGGWLLLTTAEQAAARQWPVLAAITGYGVSCDATHITAPCRQASGLIRALEQATEQGSRPVGGINAHGTGTTYNDAMEMLAFGTIWRQPPPVHSVKGAIGHCLGAAGVLEAIVAIRSLREGVLPPTVGLRTAESGQVPVSGTSSLPLRHPSVLSCNSGFGGINAAVVFAAA